MRKTCAFLVCCMLLASALLCGAEEVAHGTLFAGVWYPSALGTKKNLDESFQKISLEKLNGVAKEEIKKYPKVKQTLDILFPEEVQDKETKRKLLTLVISRATDTIFEYSVKETRLFQHFFNITASLIVVDPLTGQVEYSRVLTGELPVLENKALSSDAKGDYFVSTYRQTLQSLFKKSESEFENNLMEDSAYNFQVTEFKIKEEAEALGSFESDLRQFLHDTLVLAASKNKLKIYFLPPKSQWEAQTWEQFKNAFGIKGSAEKPLDRADALLKEGRLLTVGGILSKLSRIMVKGNEVDAYHLYASFVAGAVVERNQNGEKVSIRPQKLGKEEQILKGDGNIEYHDIQGVKATASSVSLYFDATQTALQNLAPRLINNCKLSFEEKLKEF